METVFIVIHLMVIIAMVAMVLLQRSEGGALGIGGGGGGGFMTSRGQGNILTRATAVLAAAFFATSIVLTILGRLNEPASAILDSVPAAGTQSEEGGGEGILDTLEGMSVPSDASAPALPDGTTIPSEPLAPAEPAEPQVPTSQ